MITRVQQQYRIIHWKCQQEIVCIKINYPEEIQIIVLCMYSYFFFNVMSLLVTEHLII